MTEDTKEPWNLAHKPSLGTKDINTPLIGPETRADKPKVASQPPVNKNLEIIDEIEGLISEVYKKVDALIITNKKPGDSCRKYRKNIALEEIDILLQVTIKTELRKAFE